MLGTRVKLAATLTVVVLALTGFQTSTGGSHGKSSGSGSGKSGSGKSGSGGGGGGGCSSSKKQNNDYGHHSGHSGHHDDDDDDDYGSGDDTYSPSPSASPTPTVYASVVDCVDPARKKGKGKPAARADTTATVEIGRDDFGTTRYRVVLRFLDANDAEVDRTETVLTVDQRGESAYEVPMTHPKAVDRVKKCSLDQPQELSAS